MSTAMKCGVKKHGAFAGQHITPSGARAFCVYYLGLSEIKAIIRIIKESGKKPPARRGPHHPKAGWYWITLADQAAARVDRRRGPFSASGNAFRAAIDFLDNGEE